jgi:rubrerythrin
MSQYKEVHVAKKPSYLGMLNAISLGEGRAHVYLRAWAKLTTDPDVKQVLTTVAIREGEHALAFEKRLCELGYSVIEKPDPNSGKTLEMVTSDKTDLEKFEGLGYGRERGGSGNGEDPFAAMFKDTTLDIQTSELLGRYIAEERDSGRLLTACYKELKSRAAAPKAGGTDELTEIRECIDSLVKGLDELRTEVATLRD